MLHQTVLKAHLKGLRDEANACGHVRSMTIDGYAVAVMPGGHWYQNGEAVSFKSLCFDLGLSAADFTDN